MGVGESIAMRRGFGILGLAVCVMASVMAACGREPSEGELAAAEAVKALRGVEAATRAGILYHPYSQLVEEAQASVDAAARLLPDGELKSELQAATDAYADAGHAWETRVDGARTLYPNSKPGNVLIEKYGLDTALPTTYGSVTIEPAMEVIWKAAAEHLSRASDLVGSSAEGQ
jgi:hypothetical protein